MSLLDALAVVPLRVRQAEQSLLEKGASNKVSGLTTAESQDQLAILLPVPESKCDVLQAMSIANTGNSVLAPSICAGSGMVVREI